MTSPILGVRRRCSGSSLAAGGFGSMMQAMSLFLGLIVIIISLATFVTGMMPAQILGWGFEMLGD